ncbi:MAG: hypothetical protein HQK56_02485 [Deltaproteobacteria bacterium]|nr:hypothetical protein [Deltaproteobacteria bacterium]
MNHEAGAMLLKSLIRINVVIVLLCFAVPASGASKIYLGVFDNDKEKSLSDLSGVKEFERDAGKKVAIIHVFQAWGALDGKNQFDSKAMNVIRSHGSIPLLSWAPRALHRKENQPEFALRNIIESKFDDYITRYARDIKAWNHPLFLRFAHEMNGTWYPWSEEVNGNRTGEYVRAWRHVHRIFSREGVLNVTWVWCPSRKKAASQNLHKLYPGDEYVDWLGMDGFNDTRERPWRSLETLFEDIYREITKISDKPVMIAEFSSLEEGGSKARWIRRALNVTIPERFPHVGAVVWLNHKFSSELDWRIESSATAQKAFAEAVSSPIYIGNSLQLISISPIPAP